ncbi:unnamed protein product [Arabis nemorensis]|uniref:SPX domain-containing protein n=1 Tax=Arabis nemorensis TaxID=586526 RepID=A0A565BRE9_9BRAS|nr:unnamed protein product [Arabis nemorensis]
MTEEKGGEYELVFFRRLDDEFNKVEKFYREKVEEVVKEAMVLNKQMDNLMAFKLEEERTAEMSRSASHVVVSPAELAKNTSMKVPAIEAIEEGGSSRAGRSSDEDDNNLEKEKQCDMSKMKAARPAPIGVLNFVKMINNTKEMPQSIIKSVLKVSNQTELKFSRDNLRKIEEKLSCAFVEFHRKLWFLKSYSFLNVLALSKILKKYDKITSRDAAKSYMKMVDNSYLGSSDEVMILTEHVETTFIKHFTNGNRTKGMNILRPKAKRERHRITFSTAARVTEREAKECGLGKVFYLSRRNRLSIVSHLSRRFPSIELSTADSVEPSGDLSHFSVDLNLSADLSAADLSSDKPGITQSSVCSIEI